MDRDIALAPEPKNVHATSAKDELLAKIGREGARTVPGRPEHGGNCDIKNLSRGSKVYLPVHVKGMLSSSPALLYDVLLLTNHRRGEV